MLTTALDSPAGRVLDLVGDLQKQGRISQVEAQAIIDLIHHGDFPASLRGLTGKEALCLLRNPGARTALGSISLCQVCVSGPCQFDGTAAAA